MSNPYDLPEARGAVVAAVLQWVAAGWENGRETSESSMELDFRDDQLDDALYAYAVQAVSDEHVWRIPKIPHDPDAPVGPQIRGGWIGRGEGDSNPEHTRVYAAQLLAAADELERRMAESGAVSS